MVGVGWRWLALVGVGWRWLALVGVGWRWLALVGVGWRWLAMVGGGWQDRQRSGDPENYLYKGLLDFRRKSSCFYPRHYFTLGSRKSSLSRFHCATHRTAASALHRRLKTVRDTTISDRLTHPTETTFTNRPGRQTHIDEHDGSRRHRTPLDRNSPSSTG